MAISDNRQYTKDFLYNLLEGIKGKTLGEVDSSGQFARTQKSEKITGIAGDVIEQSVFGYEADSKQECDILVDGTLTELKTTGVRVPRQQLQEASSKSGDAYNLYLRAKEGISVTRMTLEPLYQEDFWTSHFWEKAENMLIIFYEYKGYEAVPASAYADFPIVGYCHNRFSEAEIEKLKNDWEIVRDFIKPYYTLYPDPETRRERMTGFTHDLRPRLMLLELVPGYKKNKSGTAYQTPRYRLKRTFVDYIVQGHFDKSRSEMEIKLNNPIKSFSDLDRRCHEITHLFHGKTLGQLKEELQISIPMTSKNLSAACIIKMFGGSGFRLNDIADFRQSGIIAKTITLSPGGYRTEDMKFNRVDFKEWADRDIEFQDSEIASFFSEHSFLYAIFREETPGHPESITFQGFKRFAFDDDFILNEVKRTWDESRNLIFTGGLTWEFKYKDGTAIQNKSGSFKGSPNFPKSKDHVVFFRAGAADSSDRYRTEIVNNIRMLPQYYWLKGSFIAGKLATLPYL